MAEVVLAIDVGGTKIAGALVDRTGTVLARVTRPTRPPVAEVVAGVVAEVMAEEMVEVGTRLRTAEVVAAGIACAGPVDAVAGTVSPINIDSWHDFPLRATVAALLPGRPVTLAGDGLCMAVGEHWLGAGRDSPAMLGMVVSTGVGGGLVLAGRPFPGRTGNAGHVGHVIADPAGSRCPCGARGCVETVASGPNLVRWALAQGWTPNATPTPPAPETPTPTPGDDRSSAAEGGSVPGPGRCPAGGARAVTGDGPARVAAAEAEAPGFRRAAAPGPSGTGPRPRALAGPVRAQPTARELVADAAAGHPVAVAALARGGRALALAIAAVGVVCDLDLVVVGGGVGQAGDLLLDPVRAHLRDHVGLGFLAGLRVLPAHLTGADAGLAGAAALAFRATDGIS